MELWPDFKHNLFNNSDFQYGFYWGIVLIVLLELSLGWLWIAIHNQWLRMRQFFEPIKKPGRLPTETGPSPAGIFAGCMGQFLFVALAIALVILYFRGT
jgi:hypothetical protein